MNNMRFGWKKQPRDNRDIAASQLRFKAPEKLPATVDLRAGMPPIVDQGDLGSCTANAGAALVDCAEKAAGHDFLAGSRLFLYYNTRVLEGTDPSDDSGCYIRDTLKSLQKSGICKEKTWKYDIAKFSKKPTAKAFAEGTKYQAKRYALVDEAGMSNQAVLDAVKTQLAAGQAIEFGFYVYDSYGQANKTGAFPYPTEGERCVGGHAIVACGYDDGKIVTNTTDGSTTTGALLIRNSWGTEWGEAGYGWLPYDYILKDVDGERPASDFQILFEIEWLNE